MVESISNKENLTLEDTVQKEFNKLSNVSAGEIVSKSKYKTIILPNGEKIIKNSAGKEILRMGAGNKIPEKKGSKVVVNNPTLKKNNQTEKKDTKINLKEADAQKDSFFSQKLYVKKDGKYVSAELARKNIIFTKGEKVLLYRDPGIMDNGWIYEGNGKVSKIKDGTKYMVKNISNSFVYKEKETSILFSQIAYQSRRMDYLKKNVCMKENLFDHYFSKDSLSLEDGQGNIGNCYMVAAFRSLMESPNYETLIRTSVNIDNSKGNDKWVATVKIPLGVKGSKEYKIYPRDVLPQKNKFYNPESVIPPQKVPLQSVKWSTSHSKYYPEYTKKSDGTLEPIIMPKSRESLMPLKGPIGIRILEAAYVKMKDNLNNDSGVGGFDRLKIEGGMGGEAIIDMIGEVQGNPENLGTFGSKSLADQKLLEKSYKYFDDFLQYRDYGTLASRNLKGKDDTYFYNIPGVNQKIVYKHAYTIIDTDPLNKIVTIVNPWKLDQPFKLTYNQTCQAFSFISGIGVDFDKSFLS